MREQEEQPGRSVAQGGSASLDQPDYWWYRARTNLLRATLAPYLLDDARVLDVGSADGPSVSWMLGARQRVAIDVDPRGLRAGKDACASALALPFADASFDVVAAFDVVEHCEPEEQVMRELARVLRGGGRLLLSVPAYQWAWTDHDVKAGHYRRYTRPRIVAAVERAGLLVERSTYAFTSVFPMFAAERAARRLRKRVARGRSDARSELPKVSPTMDRAFMTLTRAEERVLRSVDLPFGSSVFVAGLKPR